MLEKKYHEGLKMEIEGNTFSNLSSMDNPPHVADEDDDVEANDHVDDPIKQAEKDDYDIMVALLPRKKRGLLRAIEVYFLILYASIHIIY
jgi:pescadillo protein